MLFLYHFSCIYASFYYLFIALIDGFQNSDRPPSRILKFSQLLSKNSNYRLFFRRHAKFCEVWSIRGSLLRIFDFQNGGRLPSWIWYDVTLDHPRLVFDGPNILLELHVYRVYTLQDIAIFIFGRFDLKLPIHAPFGGVLGLLLPNEFRYCRNTQKDRPLAKTRHMSHKP